MSESSGKVAILGASGLAGKRIVNEALGEGYTVRALVREESVLQLAHKRLEIVTGDANSGDAIAQLLDGCAAVISAVGPEDKDDAKNMVCSTATGHLIEHMHRREITRYILLSVASLVLPSDKRTSVSGMTSKLFGPMMLGDILRDKRNEYKMLADSELNWTMVRCPSIKDGDFQREVLVSTKTAQGRKVKTGELARFVVEQLVDTRYQRSGVFVASQ